MRAVLGSLTTDDIYLRSSSFPSTYHRSIRLAPQASMLYVCLHFDIDVLTNNDRAMREIVDRYFNDNWVISLYMGMIVDLTEEWARYPSAQAALDNVVKLKQVKMLNNENATGLAKCMDTLNHYLTSGLLTEQFVLDNTADLVNCCRDTNDAIKWRMLHRRSKNPEYVAVINAANKNNQVVEDAHVVEVLLNSSQFEMRLKEIFKNLLAAKERKWTACKTSAVGRMNELALYFTGEVALTRVKKDENLQKWFTGMGHEIDSLSMDDEHATVTGRKIQHCVQALEDVEQFDVIDTNLAIKAFLKETRDELFQMVKACNIKTEVLNILETVTDFSYAWEVLPDYLKVLHDRVKSDPATVVLLRALFLKLASILDVPVLRIMQCGSPDALSVAEYYSQELVGFVRRVMEIIPRSVFKILTNIVNIKERHLKQLPTKIEIDETKSYAQLDERYELAKLTHQVSIFTEGILAMEKTLLGVIQVDPRGILEDGIRKELVRQISEANHGVLSFPGDDKGKDEALKTSVMFIKNIQALANRVEGFRLAIEYIQDYIDLAGLRMWQSEICRIMQYNTEQEANRFLKKKIYDEESKFQSRAIPIPTFKPVDGSINFMGRTVGALLRMTDPSTTIYSPECGGWFLADGTEVCGVATIGLLRKSIGVAGLMGVDRLLGFRIVNELQQFLKFYAGTVKGYNVLLEQIRDGLFPEWKTPAEGRLYAAAMKKTEKLMLPMLIAMRRIGQAQLLRKMIMNELHFRSKLDANVLHHALTTFDESLVCDIREHYRDAEKPIPSESNGVMEQAATLLDSNGCSDPLQKIYVTTDALEGLPVLLLLFSCSYMNKFTYSTDFGTLIRSKASYPLDGWPLSVGMSTLLKQFHPSYAQNVLAYLGQYVRSSVTAGAAAAAAASNGADAGVGKDVVNTLVFGRQLAETMKLSSEELHVHFPQYLMESLTLL